MKKYIFIIIITLVCSSHLCAQIQTGANISTEDYSIVTENGFSRINYGYLFYTDSIGYPEIPVIHKSYAIPIDATNVSLQINTCTTSTLMEDCTIYPVQPPQINGGNNEIEFADPNPNLYGQTTLYPNIEAQIISDNKVMGFRIVEIALYPFAYLPNSKILYKRDISCSLNYSSTTNQLFHAPKISEQRALSVRAYVAGLVENSEDVKNTPVTFSSNVRTADPNFSVQKNVIPDYIIITNEELRGEFQRLADWKTQKGVPTIIKTVEEINEEYIGADLVDKIRNFIVDFGNQWGEEGLYLLLGGDTDVVPTREVKSWGKENRDCATDACYVDELFKITNWESGEVESSTNRNLFMGRIPISKVVEVKEFIDKLIHYEKADLDIDYSYINNLLIACAFADNNYFRYDTYFESLDDFVNKYTPERIKTWYLFDHFQCSCPTSKHRNLNYNREFGSELNKSNFMSIMQNGTLHGYPHLISYVEHGDVFKLGTSMIDKKEWVTNTDINNLGKHQNPNIFIATSCHTANFSSDCIAKSLLKRNTVAYIGNTDSGELIEYKMPDIYLPELYSTNYLNRKYSIGHLHAKILKSIVIYPHRFHLLGEPEMPIWTNTPQNLDIRISPTIPVFANSQIPVPIKIKINNLPINEIATVCIMKDTEIYRVIEISDTTEHVFMCTPLTNGKIHVTVTAHNFKPHETEIPVTSKFSVLSIENIEFLSGNNGIISPGEEVELRVSLKNSGNYDINSISATMVTASPYITFTRNYLSWGRIEGNTSMTFNRTFSFKVSNNAPEISRKDFNAVTFWLIMDKGEFGRDVDTFRVDLIPSKYRFVSHKRIGESELVAGNTYLFTSEIINTGKIEATSRIEITPETTGVDTIIHTAENTWLVNLSNNYQSGTSIKLKTSLYSNNILNDSVVIEMCDEIPNASASSIRIRENENSILLYWAEINNAYGYHIYRSTDSTGTYVRMNKMPLTSNFFIDENVNPNTCYYYKISAINSSLVEGGLSNYIKTRTLCQTINGFPVMTYGNMGDVYSVPIITDVDYNGKKEIVALLRDEINQTGKVLVLRNDGSDLYDTDNDSTTTNEFVSLKYSIATPTITDLYGKGENCLITVPFSNERRIHCYSLIHNNNNKPDSLWSTPIGCTVWQSSIVTDLNSPDGKGEKEIVVLGNPASNRIWILDCFGNNICSMNTDSTDYITSSPAVADLDDNGYKEIISSSNKHLYIWKCDGTPYKNNKACHYTSPNGLLLNSSPVICDFDGDGSKEIIIATSQSLTSYILVIKEDGTCLPNFDGTSTAASIPYTNSGSSGLNHRIAIGDIDADNKIEIVALGRDYIKAWKHDGTVCLNRHFQGLFPNSSSSHNFRNPILADIDGDESIDIIFSQGHEIYAIDNNGNNIKGFPLKTQVDIRDGITVADIDDDGLNEIITGDDTGHIYAWETQGKSSAIEWGRTQFDTENTSEYIRGYKDPWVITSSATWGGGTFPNDIIIRSGTFTIPSGVTLEMRKPYRIYVMDGGTLNVNGGTITNADIVIKEGGTLNITQNSTINLRSTGGNLQVDKGGAMNMPQGAIY